MIGIHGAASFVAPLVSGLPSRSEDRQMSRTTEVYVEIAAPGLVPLEKRIHAVVTATRPIDLVNAGRLAELQDQACDEWVQELTCAAGMERVGNAADGWLPEQRESWRTTLIFHWIVRKDRVSDEKEERSTEAVAERTAAEYGRYARVAWLDSNEAGIACDEWTNRDENWGPGPGSRELTEYVIGMGPRPPWAERIPDSE